MTAAAPRRPGIDLLVLAVALATSGTFALQARHALDAAGLDCRDYDNAEWQGVPFRTRVERDPGAEHLMTAAAGSREVFSSECTGILYIAHSGPFDVVMESDDGSELLIDDRQALDNRGVHVMRRVTSTIALGSGNRRLRLRYAQNGGDHGFRLVMGPATSTLQPLQAHAVFLAPVTGLQVFLRPIAHLVQVGAPLAWLCFALIRYRRAWPAMGDRLTAACRRLQDALTTTPARAMTTLLIAAGSVRLALTLVTFPIWWPDSASYVSTALSQLRGDFLSHELFRTPLYAAFMAPFFAVTGETPMTGAAIVAAQRLLGLATTVMVFRVGVAAFGPRIAFWGALLWTLSPLQLYYETAILSETLFTTMLVLALLLTVRGLQSPSVAVHAALGVTCGLLTLTRPVGKGFVLVVAALLLWKTMPRRRAAVTIATVVAAYLACTVPWMYINKQTYGFFAVSRGEGLGLFMRAFDFDRLPVPQDTYYPVVRESFDALRGSHPHLHYAVRDDLNYARGYSAFGTDEEMFGFAREAVAAHPATFVASSLEWWGLLFVAPHRSVHICDSSFGPHWCSQRTVGESTRAFPNRPFAGYRGLKIVAAGYAEWIYYLTPLLAPLAVIGAARIRWLARDRATAVRILIVLAIVYMTILPVLFNTIEDRYRLPVDSLIALLAVKGLAAMVTRSTEVTERAGERQPRGALFGAGRRVAG
jgi:4-amino-4-deoxy-L-arabinose transferase-like glycosyltransferase